MRPVPKDRPVHLIIYQSDDGRYQGKYVHTHCGAVNYTNYTIWNATKNVDEVTCKRCLHAITRYGRRVYFARLLRDRWKNEVNGQ